MALHSHRHLCLLSALFLAATLMACGRGLTPTPDPMPADPQARISGTSADKTPRARSTSEEQGRAISTRSATPTDSASSIATTPTPTPTPAGLPVAPAEDAPTASRCAGLSGQLEIQVLVGPSEAVGLEPFAVGSAPFAVTALEPPYVVQGQAPISYEATLDLEKGTYGVTMDLDIAVGGECSGEANAEQLNLVLEMTGEQLMVVDVEAFHAEYPWSGTQSRSLVLPCKDGAAAEGEGWSVVLHLDGQ